MSAIELNTSRLWSKINKIVEVDFHKRLAVVGSLLVGWTAQNLRQNKSVVTSNLVNSISYATIEKVETNAAGKAIPITKPVERLTLKVGTTVVYGPRVEYGFVGQDSLGRTYNQAAKPYLRPAFEAHKDQIRIILTGK